ncbi:hypothetical protein [Streptomyces sp. KL116D]|uniref:hypothetical protein n=1 Tax=Streptomyces sp. KL116D TaxID=3045152 RepID=UPI0035590588
MDDLHGDGKPIRYMDRPSKAGISSVGHAPLDYWTPQAKGQEPHMVAGVGDHFFYRSPRAADRRPSAAWTTTAPRTTGSPWRASD